MRVVGGENDGGVGEEAVIEKAAFEDEVNERIEKVPDIEGADFGSGGGGEEAQ